VTAILEARGLAVRHGRHQTLAACDVTLAPGEILGLYGPNGAGKSTLVQSLACLHPHASGEVRLAGQRVGAELSLLAFHRRTAVVFQDVLVLRGSVLDNVVLGLKLRGVPRDQRERRARHWLERLRIGHLADRVARGISGGEAQRVSLARAFALEPEVLFLDEPFAAVDAPTRARLVDELGDVLAESRTAAVVVSHDPAELVDLCDRALILDAGRVLQGGIAADVFRLPRSRRVAEIIGAENLIHARVVRSTEAGSELDWDGASLVVPRLCAAPGTQVTLLLPPDAVEVRLPPAPVPAGALVGAIHRVRDAHLLSVRLGNGHTVRAMAGGDEPAREGDTAVLVPRSDGFWIVEPGDARFVDRAAAVRASPCG
jgi:ABC-type sulfate/molybdate transport systems ATPase subunit